MIKYFLQIHAFTFLLFLVICTTSNGQVKNEVARNSNLATAKQLQYIKTQSKNEGDNVHWSLQDKAGNLWFGTTADGIYKYNGKSFTQFTTTNGLNSNAVWCILEDKSGKIWIGTNDGVCVYDGKKFARVQIPLPQNLQNNKYDVWSIMQDKSGKLWFATGIGVYTYDGKSFISFPINEDQSDCKFKVEYILEDQEGNFWFGGRCNKGVFRYDGKTISQLKPDGDNWVWPVLQDRNGSIWFSSWRGAFRYDGNLFKAFAKEDGLCSVTVTRIIEDKKGNLLVSGQGGISRFDGKHFTCRSLNEEMLSLDVWSILEDKAGYLWVGTRNTGLYRYDGKSLIKFSE